VEFEEEGFDGLLEVVEPEEADAVADLTGRDGDEGGRPSRAWCSVVLASEGVIKCASRHRAFSVLRRFADPEPLTIFSAAQTVRSSFAARFALDFHEDNLGSVYLNRIP
jgi:hypothetical protein